MHCAQAYDDGPVRCVCGVEDFDAERDAELLFVRCTNEVRCDSLDFASIDLSAKRAGDWVD
jgi:hypothetical protein